MEIPKLKPFDNNNVSFKDNLKHSFSKSTLTNYMENDAIVKDIFSILLKKFSPSNFSIYSLFTILLFIVIIMRGSMSIGNIAAETKREYYIVNYNLKDYIVLEDYSDFSVLSPIDINESRISSDYIFVDLKTNIENPLTVRKHIFPGGISVTK